MEHSVVLVSGLLQNPSYKETFSVSVDATGISGAEYKTNIAETTKQTVIT